MLNLLYIPIMSVLSRMCGGGFYGDRLKPSWLPEVFFGLTIGLSLFGITWQGFLASAWSAFFMRTGHGTAYHMGVAPQEAQGLRKQFLSPPIDWLTLKLGFKLGESFYCYTFMLLKGFLIAVPFIFANKDWVIGVLNALTIASHWPVGYMLSWYFITKDSEFAEYYTGAVVGFMLAVTLTF